MICPRFRDLDKDKNINICGLKKNKYPVYLRDYDGKLITTLKFKHNKSHHKHSHTETENNNKGHDEFDISLNKNYHNKIYKLKNNNNKWYID